MKEVTYEIFQQKLEKFRNHSDFIFDLKIWVNKHLKPIWLNSIGHWLIEHIFPRTWWDMYSFPYYYEANKDNYPYTKELSMIGKKITDGCKEGVVQRIIVFLDDSYYEVTDDGWTHLILCNSQIEVL